MQSLLRFLIRHHFAFLFLILQAVSIAFYIQSHYYQRAHFINSANSLTGNVYETVTNVEQYFLLKKENELLVLENGKLHSLADYSTLKSIDDFIVMDDTLYQQQYLYSNAQVINASVNRKNNFLTLNKGSLNGISTDMAVIGPLGVVGTTKDVSEHFSTVVPIINTNFNLDIRIKRNNQMGTVSWRNDEGFDYLYAQIIDMPITSDVLVGDTVVTSGFSHKYPKAINVGVISSVEDQIQTSSLKIRLKLFTDFSKLNHVHIIQNLFREEWKELEMDLESKADQ